MFVFSLHTCPADNGTFTATLTTPALDRRSLRWFGISACTANPEGQTSITGTARFVLASFYIVITHLSGHTRGTFILIGGVNRDKCTPQYRVQGYCHVPPEELGVPARGWGAP